MAIRGKVDGVLFSGIVLIAFGIILISAFAGAFLGPAMANRTVFTEIKTNEYASPNITLDGGSILYVLNVTKNFYLVPAQDVSNLTAGSIAEYAISPVKGGSVNVGGTVYLSGDNSTLYGNLDGQYTIVTFSPSYPSITYVTVHPGTTAIVDFAIIGFVIFFISVPVIIFGIIRQVRMMRNKRDLEELMRM